MTLLTPFRSKVPDAKEPEYEKCVSQAKKRELVSYREHGEARTVGRDSAEKPAVDIRWAATKKRLDKPVPELPDSSCAGASVGPGGFQDPYL